MTARRPVGAPTSTPSLPPLDAVARTHAPGRWAAIGMAVGFAGGALGLQRAEAPVCGATRTDELTAHGANASASAQRGDVRGALRELAVAMGFVGHGPSFTQPQTPDVDGGVEAVTTAPLPTPPPPQVEPDPSSLADGQMMTVRPTPPPQPATPPRVRSPGEAPSVTTLPSHQPRPGGARMVRPSEL